MAKHTPTPYTASDRNWRGEKDADGSYYVTGGGYYAHDEECVCECDGHLEDCDCTDGCGWVGTAVCVVPGNLTAGDIPRATAEFICRAANCHDELLAALKAMLRPPKWLGRESDDYAEPVRLARAAIAKAGE